MLSHDLRIVLVATSHPGNIGAVARAMKNMGLEQLYLVAPKAFPNVEATARAAGADDILAKAKVVNCLEEALVGCTMVIGTSARNRNFPIPLLDAREAASKAVAEASLEQRAVAIVFGRENNGLTNEELQKCHYHLCIPSNPDFSSLNVASAVQIVVYEIMMVAEKYRFGDFASNIADQDVLATAEEMAQFYEHLRQTLIELGVLNPQQPRRLMERLRRLFNRARPEHLEINVLRGILREIQKKLLIVNY